MTRLLVPLALTVAIAGCGSSSDNSKPTPAPAAPGGGAAIEMQGIKFSPANATVKVGQKVTWTNKDSVDHNVIADSGASFKSSEFGQGETYSFTPTKAGTIKYECTLHPGMRGVLTVTG